MPTAKSYANLTLLTEPYYRNGRQYVKVLTKKNIEKEVRWYSENEYEKMYGETSVKEEAPKSIGTQKQALGFEKGYITIFKGDTYAALDWFQQSIARYTRVWGWYIVSTDEVPQDLPAGIDPVILKWETVGTADGTLKSEDAVKEAVDQLIYEPSNSQFVGEIGERIEIEVTIKRRIPLETNYGMSNMHIMEDANGNIFTWTTASKVLDESKDYHLRGTIKNHSRYKGDCQTVLTRCMII